MEATRGGEGVSDPEGLLAALAARSRRKLMTSKNLAKGSWIDMSDEEILGRIREEINELLRALLFGSWDEIADEAADVYHFAGMGADPARKEAKG